MAAVWFPFKDPARQGIRLQNCLIGDEKINTRFWLPHSIGSRWRCLNGIYTIQRSRWKINSHFPCRCSREKIRFLSYSTERWDERPDPSWKVQQAAKPSDVKSTLEFIHFALELARSNEISKLWKSLSLSSHSPRPQANVWAALKSWTVDEGWLSCFRRKAKKPRNIIVVLTFKH